MIVVDTSVWVPFFNGVRNTQTTTLLSLLGNRKVIVGDVILTEVLQGFRSQRDYESAKRLMTRVPAEEMLGEQAAIAAADSYRLLRRRGITIRKTIDVIIATHCVREGHTLLHDDRDFTLAAPVLGLREL